MPDPVRIVDSLDPDALLAEVAELTRRRDAVLVLLRAARARQRGRHPRQPRQEGRDAHAR
jgi:hypothetical protein